ncbi:MAG: ABC transporter permease subunit [Bdellovibrionota bacterium]
MQKISTIAINTFRESIRSKILYSLIIFAGVLVLISSLFGSVTIGEQDKVVKDFGLFCISIFTIAYAVISGASMVHKELSKKTIYNILSKAVRRWEFLLGKFLGMFLTLLVMLALMGSALLALSYLLESQNNLLLLQAYFYQALELLIICATVIFFSAIVVTPLLSGLFTFGVFLVGRSISYLLFFVESGEVSGLTAKILKLLNLVLPNLDKLNINDEVVHGYSMTPEHMLWSTVYAVSYAIVLLILAAAIFRKREF